MVKEPPQKSMKKRGIETTEYMEYTEKGGFLQKESEWTKGF